MRVHAASILCFSLVFQFLGSVPLANAQSSDTTFIISPSCPDQEEGESSIFGEVPYIDGMIKLGDGRCYKYEVEDPENFKTRPLSKGDTLEFDIAVDNPSQKAIKRMRAWLSYDPTVLKGLEIDISSKFGNITPGEQDFDPSEGFAMIDAATDAGKEIAERTVRLGKVSFEVLEEKVGGTVISFFEPETDGHTFIEDKDDNNILGIDPSNLLVLFDTNGNSCESDDDCEDGICQEGVCTDAVGSNDGASCVIDSQCASGNCTNGICGAIDLLPNGEECGSDTECESGNCIDFVCSAGDGSLSDGSSCSVDAECASNLCLEGFCASDLLPIGDVCSDDSECESGLCFEGLCSEDTSGDTGDVCTVDAQCTSGNCDNGVCTDDSGNADGDACFFDEDCDSGNCTDGICTSGSQLPNGENCIADVECLSGNCEQGICTDGSAGSEGDSCLLDSDCESGDCDNGVCTGSKSNDGEQCTQDSECLSNNCDQGICSPEGSNNNSGLQNGSVCSADIQCASGSCVDGRCADDTTNVDTTAFALLQVQNLQAMTQGGAAFLKWDALRSSQLKGYNIYYGTVSGKYIHRKTVDANTTNITIEPLPEGTTYYFAVRAVSQSDEESAFSQEVSLVIGDPNSSSNPFTTAGDMTAFVSNPVQNGGHTPMQVPGEVGSSSTIALLLLLSASIGTIVAARRQMIVLPPQK